MSGHVHMHYFEMSFAKEVFLKINGFSVGPGAQAKRAQ